MLVVVVPKNQVVHIPAIVVKSKQYITSLSIYDSRRKTTCQLCRMTLPTLMPSRLRIVRTSLNSDIEERASFPVVEMAGLEPAMRQDTWLVGSHYLFWCSNSSKHCPPALPLRHISMYYRLSRCAQWLARLNFTVFARGFNPLQTLPHGGSQIPHTFCHRSQPPPQDYSTPGHYQLARVASFS